MCPQGQRQTSKICQCSNQFPCKSSRRLAIKRRSLRVAVASVEADDRVTFRRFQETALDLSHYLQVFLLNTKHSFKSHRAEIHNGEKNLGIASRLAPMVPSSATQKKTTSKWRSDYFNSPVQTCYSVGLEGNHPTIGWLVLKISSSTSSFQSSQSRVHCSCVRPKQSKWLLRTASNQKDNDQHNKRSSSQQGIRTLGERTGAPVMHFTMGRDKEHVSRLSGRPCL